MSERGIDTIVTPPLPWLRRAAVAALVVGGLLCLLGLGSDREQFFRAYLVGALYWVGIPLGCLGLLMIQHLTGGDWGVVLRRVLEASTRTLPLVFLLFLPVFLGGMEALYPWTHLDAPVVAAATMGDTHASPGKTDGEAVVHPAAAGHAAMGHGEGGHDGTGHGVPGGAGIAAYVTAKRDFLEHKRPYLNVPFFQARYVLYFALWIALALILGALSARQDRTADPRLIKRMQQVSAPGLIVLALSASFASYDWLMSIYPTWFSTMYGVYFLITFGIGALAFLVIAGSLLARREPLDGVLQPRHFHDWGKLLFAFVVLWAYTTISQFLIIWSGNLPDEIAWYLPRFRGHWLPLTVALFLLHFALPFLLLLSQDVKKRAPLLALVAGLMLAVRWVDLMWQVAPSIEALWQEPVASLWWMGLGTTLALGGVWLLVFQWQLGRRPILPVNDPYLKEAMAHGHGH
jgi:hypothetical protein